MKDSEIRAVLIVDKTLWELTKLISSKLTYSTEDGQLKPANATVTVLELLNGWLSEMSLKFFPILLKDFTDHNIENDITKYMTEGLKGYIESARINKDESDIKTLRDHMLKANWTESEINEFMGDS